MKEWQKKTFVNNTIKLIEMYFFTRKFSTERSGFTLDAKPNKNSKHFRELQRRCTYYNKLNN